jgi:hypothetical protein
MLARVASNRASKGFDYREFWRKFGHSTEKLNLIALAASDRDNPISADWLESWLRSEVERRRAELSSEAKSEVGTEVGAV